MHFSHGASTSVQDEIQGSSSSVHDQKFGFEQPNGADFITNKLTDARLDSDRTVQNFAARGDGLSPALDIKGLTAASQRAVQVNCLSAVCAVLLHLMPSIFYLILYVIIILSICSYIA